MNGHKGRKQMSYKYWLAAMIAQGNQEQEFEFVEDFADDVVNKTNAIIDRLRQDKIDRNQESDFEH